MAPQGHGREGSTFRSRERSLLDSVALGEWALELIAETFIDGQDGRLHPEFDAQMGEGAPRMVIIRGIPAGAVVAGYGLGGVLLAGALRILAPAARLAACRISPTPFFSSCPDRLSVELASVRMAAMVERVGFRRWRGVHIVDLNDQALLDAGWTCSSAGSHRHFTARGVTDATVHFGAGLR